MPRSRATSGRPSQRSGRSTPAARVPRKQGALKGREVQLEKGIVTEHVPELGEHRGLGKSGASKLRIGRQRRKRDLRRRVRGEVVMLGGSRGELDVEGFARLRSKGLRLWETPSPG
jgi:hypothetical protein